jgi:hypothetical protein
MGKKSVTITLKKDELIDDIHNKTYLTGESRKNGSNHEDVAHMKSNDDEEDMDQILRSIKNAFSNLKTKLSEYLISTDSDSKVAANNGSIGDDDGDLTLVLSMPSNYNVSTADTVADAAHQYVVNSVIADWFTITNKTDAEDYGKMAEVNLSIILEAVNKRLRPTKRVASQQE